MDKQSFISLKLRGDNNFLPCSHPSLKTYHAPTPLSYTPYRPRLSADSCKHESGDIFCCDKSTLHRNHRQHPGNIGCAVYESLDNIL